MQMHIAGHIRLSKKYRAAGKNRLETSSLRCKFNQVGVTRKYLSADDESQLILRGDTRYLQSLALVSLRLKWVEVYYLRSNITGGAAGQTGFSEKDGHTVIEIEESLQGVFPSVFKGYFQKNLDAGILKSLKELKEAAE